MENARRYAVLKKLVAYVKSPSLKHIRDPHSLQLLAEEIVQVVDQASSVWTKWEGRRDDVIKAAAPCWVPMDELRDWLNRLPGPTLTLTDVAQRLRTVWEEPYNSYPKEALKAGCLALFEAEKAQGTDMPAIIGALQDHIEVEEERLRREHEAAYRQSRLDEQARLEQRFLAGADSGWIHVQGSKDFFCRKNGRAFRISQQKDKRWKMFRISNVNDEGDLLGIYQSRGDANKALKSIAYEPEPRW